MKVSSNNGYGFKATIYNFKIFIGHVIVTVLEPIPTTGLTLDDLPVLKQRTFDIMLEHFEKISREMDRLSTDKEWLNKKWPRLTITRKSN